MAYVPFTKLPQQFFDNLGNPLVNGTINAYLAGTSTPTNMFSDDTGTVAGTSVTLDSRGEPTTFKLIWLDETKNYKFILKDSTGSTIWTIDNISADDPTSSNLVSYTPAGTGAVTTTVQTKLRESVSVKDFGAVGNGVTDDTVAIQAAITYAKTLVSPELVIDAGTYLVSSRLVFDLPNYSTIRFLGLIRSSVSSDPAIRIGSATTNTFGLSVSGIKVERTSIDTTTGSTGVELRNLSGASVDIRWCLNFNFGIVCFGDQPNGGFSYNEVNMGIVHDNRTNLYLTASGTGYCNENSFYSGSFNHSSSFPAISTTNLLINNFPTSALNNNRFFGPSFEDNSVLAVAAVLNGQNNVIYWPRMENPAALLTYQIQFTANSLECRVIGNSYGLLSSTNISDLGQGNMYETRVGTVMRYQTGTAAGSAVLKLQSYATGSAKVLSGLDSGGTERSYITGDGDAYFTRAVTIAGVPTSGTAGALTLGIGTQTTIGGAGGASALPATPLGYVRFWIGTTEVAIPFYNRV